MSDLVTQGAIDAVVTAYAISPQAAEAALSKAVSASRYTMEDFFRLFGDPNLNPLPEAAARGYALGSVLDVITKLAMMLGRTDMRLTAEELKTLWSRGGGKPDSGA
jgi:hypothetical protein